LNAIFNRFHHVNMGGPGRIDYSSLRQCTMYDGVRLEAVDTFAWSS
jgi:hypothetical protein